MSKIAIYPALLSIFLATGCAFFEQQPPPTAPAKTSAERITVHGLSRDIISEARQIATEHCKEQDRRFTFLRNAFRKKTWLGIDWLTCDLYFACTAEGEAPPAIPAYHAAPDEIITDTEAHHDTPPGDVGKDGSPDTDKKPTRSAAVLPTKNPAADQYGAGELESLGPKPLDPGDLQPSEAQDKGIVEEILK